MLKPIKQTYTVIYNQQFLNMSLTTTLKDIKIQTPAMLTLQLCDHGLS